MVRGSEVRSQIQGSVGIWSDLGDHPIRPFAIVVHPHAIAHFRPHLRSRGGGAQGRGVGRGVVVLKVGAGRLVLGLGSGVGVSGRGQGLGQGHRQGLDINYICNHNIM